MQVKETGAAFLAFCGGTQTHKNSYDAHRRIKV